MVEVAQPSYGPALSLNPAKAGPGESWREQGRCCLLVRQQSAGVRARAEDATTRGRSDGRSWNDRGSPPVAFASPAGHGCLCLRVETAATGPGSAVKAQRPRETEPLTGMAWVPRSRRAPTAEPAGCWRQQRSGSERGARKQGPWCSIHRFDTTKPAAPACAPETDACAWLRQRDSPVGGSAAGNAGNRRRREAGDC